MKSLRQRIRKDKINYDILEIELIEEGWLYHHETLFEVLENINNLKRKHLSLIENEEETLFNETWTEEDYKYYYDNL